MNNSSVLNNSFIRFLMNSNSGGTLEDLDIIIICYFVYLVTDELETKNPLLSTVS